MDQQRSVEDEFLADRIKRRETVRRYHARKQGKDVPRQSGGRNRLPPDDPRIERAKKMWTDGVPKEKIRDILKCSRSNLRAWLDGIPFGQAAASVITPRPYASGYRYFNTKW